jgi:hypothetical protein
MAPTKIITLPKYKLSKIVCMLLDIPHRTIMYRHEVIKGFIDYARKKDLLHNYKIKTSDSFLNSILGINSSFDLNVVSIQNLLYHRVMKGNEFV